MKSYISSSLYNLIFKYQLGDKNAFLEIHEKFMPLIKKYSRKLNYDGSYSDMIITLLEIIKKIPINKGGLEIWKVI